jgi:hypothetical protein
MPVDHAVATASTVAPPPNTSAMTVAAVESKSSTRGPAMRIAASG